MPGSGEDEDSIVGVRGVKAQRREAHPPSQPTCSACRVSSKSGRAGRAGRGRTCTTLVRSATRTMPWSRSTLTAEPAPVAGTTMQRTQSSLLSFNLRDFLDAADEVPMATIAEGEEDKILPNVENRKKRMPSAERQDTQANTTGPTDGVRRSSAPNDPLWPLPEDPKQLVTVRQRDQTMN